MYYIRLDVETLFLQTPPASSLPDPHLMDSFQSSFERSIVSLRREVEVLEILKSGFIASCHELFTLLSIPSSTKSDVLAIKHKLDTIERFLKYNAVLRRRMRFGLWNRAYDLVKRKLRQGTQKYQFESREEFVASQLVRMNSISRTYRRGRHSAVKLRDCCSSSREICPFDDGYYRIKHLVDELGSTSHLPNDLFSVVGLNICDAHLSLICRLTHCDLRSVTRLDLGSNKICQVDGICRLLGRSTKLLHVSVRGNDIAVSGILKLVHAIEKKPGFICLDVRDNSFESKELRQYILLELDKTKSDGIGAFKSALEKTLVAKKTSALTLLSTLLPTNASITL
jgi:hypothetical protein